MIDEGLPSPDKDSVSEYQPARCSVRPRSDMRKSLHSTQNSVFLRLLRDTRVNVRLRQADLAIRIGAAQATVSKVERGERRLDVIELRAWLQALDVSFVDFVSELDRRLP